MKGKFNSDKTEISGVGTFTQIIPAISDCNEGTAIGSANCKILIPH
ncbi:MAG: hypothetical protein NT094_01500 [Candidatus Staskawiczbacteria bacterium]|nr:hypothetical protein [Candidatus Staskawiczbacteria bacterium]